MKLLVATKKTQGERGNDFNFCEEGEIVSFAMECDRENIDGHCGCRRSMSGMDNHKGTTTMLVAELDMTLEELRAKWMTSMTDAGWLKGKNKEREARWCRQECDRLIKAAASFGVGDVVEKRGDTIQKRVLR